MARVESTIRALTKAGTNLTDHANFETFATGSNNGRTIIQNSCDLIFLKNDTGGSAAFTVKAQVSPSQTAAGISVTDSTVTVADGKTYTLSPEQVLADSSGLINIDCDVAGEILAVSI